MSIQQLVQAHPYVSGLAVLVLTAWAYHIFFITALPSEPPLIKGYFPFLGAGPQVLLNPRRFIAQSRAQYGDIYTIYAFGMRVSFVSDPIDGVPAVFRKSKQMNFRAALRKVYIKVLGFSPQRADNSEMNKEHFDMIPPYLLNTNAVNGLTERFIRYLGADIAQRATTEGFAEGKVVDLEEWIGARLFYNSAPALYGEGIFDGADSVLQDFKKFDKDFPKALMLPKWMTEDFARARGRLQKVLATKFAQGLNDPSEFVKKRTEIQLAYPGQTLEAVGSDLVGITFGLMVTHLRNTSLIVDQFNAHVVLYYKPVLERIRSHQLPSPNLLTGELFDVDALLGDPLLQACFQETLRIRTQTGSTRIVYESTTLTTGGKEYLIRKDSVVFIPSWLIHYDPEIYKNPNEYQPERFLGADLESALIADPENPATIDRLVREKKPPKFFRRGRPVRHYMLPFGGGENLCTGRRFAQNEIIAMGATILYLFEFEAPDGGKLEKPADPAGKRFGAGAEGPGKPFIVKMKLRSGILEGVQA